MFSFVIIFSIIAAISIYSLIKERVSQNMSISIQHNQPGNVISSQYIPCPKCGGTNAEKIDYSWWGGFIGPRLVHEVRCKNCGKAYNGKTGGSVTRNVVIYTLIFTILVVLLIALKYIF